MVWEKHLVVYFYGVKTVHQLSWVNQSLGVLTKYSLISFPYDNKTDKLYFGVQLSKVSRKSTRPFDLRH